jgi:acetyl esterase/lipase
VWVTGKILPLDLIRFFAAFVCVLVALTALCKVSWIPLWMLQLGATEYGHWFALAPLLIGLTGARRPLSLAATLLAVAAFAIFLSTVFRARALAKQLERELPASFGNVPVHETAFSWGRLWFGSREKPVEPESMIYQKQNDFTLRLNFYRSALKAPAPCVIVLHTGGWNNGTPDEFLALNSHLARRGYAVAALEYRLAPRWTWPAQRDDTLAALAFLKQHAADLGLNPAKFVLLGRSAGGQIAEAVAYSAHDPSIRGCIAFYAPADMNFAYLYSREDDILHPLKLLRDFLGGTPEQAGANYDSASPIRFVNNASPPTLLLHGRPDPLIWFQQSERLAAALKSMHTLHFLVAPPWGTHAFDYNFNGPGGQLSAFAVDYFLDAVTT